MIRLGLNIGINSAILPISQITNPSTLWILITGFWVDLGTTWQDNQVWID